MRQVVSGLPSFTFREHAQSPARRSEFSHRAHVTLSGSFPRAARLAVFAALFEAVIAGFTSSLTLDGDVAGTGLSTVAQPAPNPLPARTTAGLAPQRHGSGAFYQTSGYRGAALAETVPPDLLQLIQQEDGSFLIGNASGRPGEAIPIPIKLPDDAMSQGQSYTFLMFRGVPDEIEFTSGFRIRNNWAISLQDIQRLALVARRPFTGTFSLEVVLHRGKQDTPLTRTMTVDIQPIPSRLETTETKAKVQPQPSSAPTTAVASTAAVSDDLPRAVPPVAAVDPAQEKPLLANGWKFLETGNIATARMIFQDLAIKGSAGGAYALAQTYDPSFLKRMVVVGAEQANIEEARKWYQIAAERGEPNARERLSSFERK